MNTVPLTWGAVDPELIITIAIVLFGIIIPLVLNVINKLKQAQEKMVGGRQPQQPRPADAKVEDEIGEFLRRAANRGQAPPQQPKPAPKPTRRLVQEQPDEAVVLDPSPHRPVVAEQVDRDIDTRKFGERAQQTQRRAGQASRKAQQRGKKFDHEVGHLAGTPGAAAQPARASEAAGPEDRLADVGPALAAGLPALLRNTDNLRQAIVINEILQRPEQRWE